MTEIPALHFAVASRSASLLESHYLSVPPGNGERKGEVANHRALTARNRAVREKEVVHEGYLGPEINPSMLEEGIERLTGIHVTIFDLVKSIVLNVEGPEFTLRLPDLDILLLVRGV